MNTNVSILVTGAAGLIGSSLVWRLNQLGYTNLTLVDRLGKTDKWRNLVGLKYREYLEADAFAARRREVPCTYDTVFLLGACSSTRETDASYLMQNNVQNLIETIDWCRQTRRTPLSSGDYSLVPNPPRIIYASSAATYGLGKMSDAMSPAECRPINPYALSKNMVDQTLSARGLLDTVVGLKFFNVFGPNSRHKGVMTDFIAKTYDQIKKDGKVTLFDTHTSAPDGKDARDFLYVKDAVDMMVHFAFGAGSKANGLFNIGSGVAASWDDVTQYVFDALGKPSYKVVKGTKREMGNNTTVETFDLKVPLIMHEPMPPALKDRYQYYTCADISKLRASGYDKPITPIADAIKDYVQNYLVPDKRLGEVPEKT